MKLTTATIKRFTDAMRLGATFEHAALYAGIHKSTAYRWLEEARGENPDPLHTAFAEAVDNAEGAFIVSNLAVIEKAAQAGTWQAAAWRLERRHPDQFALRSRMNLHHEGGEDIGANSVARILGAVAALDDDRLAALDEELGDG